MASWQQVKKQEKANKQIVNLLMCDKCDTPVLILTQRSALRGELLLSSPFIYLILSLSNQSLALPIII